jgi:hypothetical protein
MGSKMEPGATLYSNSDGHSTDPADTYFNAKYGATRAGILAQADTVSFAQTGTHITPADAVQPIPTAEPAQDSSYGNSSSKVLGKARPSGDPQAAASMASLLTEGDIYVKTLLGQ